MGGGVQHERARRAGLLDDIPGGAGRAVGDRVAYRIFTGRLVKKHLSFPERAMVTAIRAQEGDVRNWAEIRAWATSIADILLAR